MILSLILGGDGIWCVQREQFSNVCPALNWSLLLNKLIAVFHVFSIIFLQITILWQDGHAPFILNCMVSDPYMISQHNLEFENELEVQV